MTVSLNEVEATAKKAARGAGFSWGLAEDAGAATRWLCAHGFDGCGLLARLLEKSGDFGRPSPQLREGVWVSDDGHLCPITAGPSLSDMAHDLESDVWKLTDVEDGAFLIPFLAEIAKKLRHPVGITSDGFSIVTDGENIEVSGALKAGPQVFEIRKTPSVPALGNRFTRANPADRDWDTLLAFAHRTYAPATQASRLMGAGAGTTDND